MLQNKWKGIASLFKIFTLLLLVLGTYFIIFLKLNGDLEMKHSFKLPADRSTYVVIDARQEMGEVAAELMLSGNGDVLIEKLKGKISKDSDSRTYGIHWLQPIYYFKSKYKGKELQGLIVSIIDEHAWNAEINKLFGNVSAALKFGRSGMVVQSQELSREELYAFLNEHQLEQARKLIAKIDNELIAVDVEDDRVKSQFNVGLSGRKLTLNGDLTMKEINEFGALNYKLKAASFHVTTDLITQQVRDSIQKLLGRELPLSGLSMNYDGIVIKEEAGVISPVPNAALIMGFSKPFSMDSLLSLIPNWSWKEVNKSIVYGGTIFYVQQLDAYTIYLGQNAQPEIEKITSKVGLVANGSFRSLIALEGNSFVRMALGMNPAFVFMRDLSNKTEKVDLKISHAGSSTFKIESELLFKDGKSATLSLVELAVNRAM